MFWIKPTGFIMCSHFSMGKFLRLISNPPTAPHHPGCSERSWDSPPREKLAAESQSAPEGWSADASFDGFLMFLLMVSWWFCKMIYIYISIDLPKQIWWNKNPPFHPWNLEPLSSIYFEPHTGAQVAEQKLDSVRVWVALLERNCETWSVLVIQNCSVESM